MIIVYVKVKLAGIEGPLIVENLKNVTLSAKDTSNEYTDFTQVKIQSNFRYTFNGSSILQVNGGNIEYLHFA